MYERRIYSRSGLKILNFLEMQKITDEKKNTQMLKFASFFILVI